MRLVGRGDAGEEERTRSKQAATIVRRGDVAGCRDGLGRSGIDKIVVGSELVAWRSFADKLAGAE